MNNSYPLEGIIVPLVTPLNRDGSLDTHSLRAITRHVLAGGVAGLFVLGSTGEFPLLCPEDRPRIIATVLEETQGRVPVLAGVSAPGTAQALTYCREAEALGVAAVVATAPYYYRLHDAVEGYQHFRAIAEGTALPVFLYNIPQFTQMSLALDTVQRLAELLNVVGMKDSSSDFTYFARLCLRLKRDRSRLGLYQGNECHLLASLALGAAGGVSGLGNVAPQLVVQLWRAFQAGDFAQAKEAQEKIVSLFDIARLGPNAIPAIKAALSELGLCSPQVASPLQPLDDDQRAQVRIKLEELALL